MSRKEDLCSQGPQPYPWFSGYAESDSIQQATARTVIRFANNRSFVDKTNILYSSSAHARFAPWTTVRQASLPK